MHVISLIYVPMGLFARFSFLHVLIFCGHCSFGLFFSYQRSYAFSDDYSHLNRHLGVYQRRCYFTYLRSNRLFRTFLNCYTSFLLICIVFFLSTFISTRFSPFSDAFAPSICYLGCSLPTFPFFCVLTRLYRFAPSSGVYLLCSTYFQSICTLFHSLSLGGGATDGQQTDQPSLRMRVEGQGLGNRAHTTNDDTTSGIENLLTF